MRNTISALALGLALAGLGCESSRVPGGPGGGDGGDDGGDAGGGGGDAGGGGGDAGGGGDQGGGGGDDRSVLDLLVEPRGGPPGATQLTLDVVAVVLFVDRSPAYRDADSPCDAGGGQRLDASTEVTVGLPGGDAAPVASMERTGGGSLREVVLVLREGVLVREGRGYRVHAGALCTMPDGQQYTLLRLRPPAPANLGGGADYDLVARLDGNAVNQRRVRCDDDSSGPGGGDDDDREPEECRAGDDPGDDDDDRTRLVFTFGRELPVDARRAP